jgi:hypothetical protein
MSLHRFHCDALTVSPWKNGGGATREIACWPPGAGLGDFGWRVSIATIAASGPFSVFGGVERQIMLLDGDGVRLRSGDGRIDHVLDTPHAPFAFTGDAPIDCALLGGPSSDFNVMARRGQWRADLQVLRGASLIELAPHGVLLALRGSWRLRKIDEPASALDCRAGEGLCWTDAETAWQAEPQAPGTPDAVLAIVRFSPG